MTLKEINQHFSSHIKMRARILASVAESRDVTPAHWISRYAIRSRVDLHFSTGIYKQPLWGKNILLWRQYWNMYSWLSRKFNYRKLFINLSIHVDMHIRHAVMWINSLSIIINYYNLITTLVLTCLSIKAF